MDLELGIMPMYMVRIVSATQRVVNSGFAPPRTSNARAINRWPRAHDESAVALAFPRHPC